MERAVVLIGVGTTGGGLAQLNAVQAGIDQMQIWAKSQGIRASRVITITDAGGKTVTADAIKKKIRKLCELATLDQLVVYFTGHGVVIGSDEYWLLSGAPSDLGEAVYVQGTLAAAQKSSLPVANVVLVSDACRSQATGLFQYIRGTIIFDGYDGGDDPKVDRLYATALESAAYEVRGAQGEYHAVYTESLVATLGGAHPQVVIPDAASGIGQIRLTMDLQKVLADDVGTRLEELKVDPSTFQLPKVYAVSDSVISLVKEPPVLAPGPLRPLARRVEGGPVSAKSDPVGRLHDLMRRLAGLPAPDASGPVGGPADLIVIADPGSAVDVAAPDAAALAAPDAAGAARLVVTGAGVVSAESGGQPLAADAGRMALSLLDGVRATEVLVQLEGGSAVILPAAASATTVASFANGELRDVALVADGVATDLNLQRLRGAVAARMRTNDLWLAPDEADALVRIATKSGACDPVLALYTAYAVHDLVRQGDVRRLDDAVREQWGFRLFDLAMLTGDLDGRAPSAADGLQPAMPLLLRGWSSVRIKGIDLGPGMDAIQPHLLPSIWTQFDPDGIDIVRRAANG